MRPTSIESCFAHSFQFDIFLMMNFILFLKVTNYGFKSYLVIVLHGYIVNQHQVVMKTKTAHDNYQLFTNEMIIKVVIN